MLWIAATLTFLAALFWLIGWRWESTVERPDLKSIKNVPLVSILIPAYKSADSIEDTLKSVKNMDYPKKEVIVVNDSNDETPEICKNYNVKVIQNKKRIGKAIALNKAVEKTKGSILFFLDADTTVTKDCLSKVIPWFSKKDIAVVAPKYIVKNKKNILTRLISLENSFLSSLFKTHMFFGSLIAFRGCGVAIRKDVFKKVGGWSNTLIEDTDFAAKIVRKGYTIQYEPSSVIKTDEPETISSLKKQRYRWGKGAYYVFSHHKRAYSKHFQFFTHIYIYLLLALAIIGFVFWQSTLFFIPFMSLYFIYAFSIKEFLMISILFIVPLFSNLITSVTTASVAHMAILTYPEKEKYKDMLLIIPYIFFYLPMVMFFYFKGMLAGFRDKRKKRSELDLKTW